MLELTHLRFQLSQPKNYNKKYLELNGVEFGD